MPPKSKKYLVWYKKSSNIEWHFSGYYNKTDVLGTAGLLLKEGYEIKLCPEIKNYN